MLSYGLALVLLALATRNGYGLEASTAALFCATPWLAAAAVVLVTIHLYWVSLAEQLLTLRHLCGAILITVVFVAAGVAVQGVQPAGMFATDAVLSLSPALLPLMTIVLAPWSLSRIRHM
jgi:hypothetical protein